MLRAYIRGIPGRAASKQREMAKAAGITALYEEEDGRYPEKLNACIKSVRPKESVWVSDVAVLANSRDKLMPILVTIEHRGGGLVEGSTERTDMSLTGAQMVLGAVEYWARSNKTFGKLTAGEAGAIGGTKSGKRHKKNRMPKNLAREVWQAKNNMDVDMRLATINADDTYKKKWTKSSAYSQLGKSGGDAGRRGKRPSE